MDDRQFWDDKFKPGDRLTYVTAKIRLGHGKIIERPAKYIRDSGSVMCVIELDETPGRPRTVGHNSIRRV